jgi:hypothetical protein
LGDPDDGQGGKERIRHYKIAEKEKQRVAKKKDEQNNGDYPGRPEEIKQGEKE